MVDLSSGPETRLLERIWGEFNEMPGLRLTLEQAARLWDVDPVELGAVLQELVEQALLQQIGPYFVRADLGRFTA